MYIWMFILVGLFGRGDDTVGSPHLTQMSQFELFELILLLKLDELFPVEQQSGKYNRTSVTAKRRNGETANGRNGRDNHPKLKEE